MREMNVGQDCDFNLDRFATRYTTDLGNDLGNLLSRVVNMLHRYCGGIIPELGRDSPVTEELHSLWNTTKRSVLAQCEILAFNTALGDLFSFIASINKFIEQNAPWKLAKSSKNKDQVKLKLTLAAAAESIRLAALLLAPVMPSTAPKILDALGTNPEIKWDDLDFGNHLSDKTVAKNVILFPRLETNS
jgi:methionyl-tRNA synthetase